MDELKSIEQAQRYLLEFSPPKLDGTTYTLGRMRELMRRLGDPQDSCRVIHVAGTSGKTSTAYFIRGLLQSAGCKTGLTASPHVVSITERVQINGSPLPDDEFLRYLNDFLARINEFHDIRPTYFELLVAFAFVVFREEQVEYAIVEVGMGGLLDATNVITRPDKISVITPLGLDHTQVLGETIAEIAHQKAGIILPGSHVFVAPQIPEAEVVVETVCRMKHATYHPIKDASIQDGYLPPFQQRNLATARAVFDYVVTRDGLPSFDEEALSLVTRQTPPGRFEVYSNGPKTIILDGAHNPQKLRAFIEACQGRLEQDTVWVVGLVDAPESKLRECIDILTAQPGRFIVTEFGVGQDLKARRSVSAARLAELAAARHSDVLIEADPANALTLANKMPGSTVIVTGSLYLVSELRPHFG